MKRSWTFLVLLVCLFSAPAETLTLSWKNNMLRITGPQLPGGYLETWYLEAFCRSGSTHQEWHNTVIPHKTELLRDENGKRLLLKSIVEPNVVVYHEILAGSDEVTFNLRLINEASSFVDVQWFQPCVRVDRFTGRKQADYPERCFIYTSKGLQTLDKIRRTEEAIYKGGQVYVPTGVPLKDVNPRPISPVQPLNALIGCFSADDKWIFATAWSDTQELFQGVIVCIHNDPRVGGLRPGEEKKLFGKMYFLPNDPKGLLERYERDFKKK